MPTKTGKNPYLSKDYLLFIPYRRRPRHAENCLLSFNTKRDVCGIREDFFDKQKQASMVRYSVRRLESLGYNVSISEVS
jgi:hypothetical protein